MKYRNLAILLAALAVACQPHTQHTPDVENASDNIVSVGASAETTPTLTDGANDPAIWINAENPEKSLILGSGSAGGLEIYDLNGNRVGVMGERAISLVDVRYNFPLAGNEVSLVVAYDAVAAELVAYTIDPAVPSLREISSEAIRTGTEIEGLCMYQSPLSGKYYAFAAGDGMIQQWEFFDLNGKASARQIRAFPVGLGAGHCVVHDRGSMLYFSLETLGVFRLSAEPETEAEKEFVDLAQPFGRYAGDVKGVTIYEQEDKSYLIVSDADESRLQVYDLDSLEHVGTLTIDSADESEGIAATAVTLSAESPGGLLVVTDDDNEGQPTNYKIVSGKSLAVALDLKVGTAHNPTDAMEINTVTVHANVETEPVSSFGDAADDPAIWVHPEDPALSLIIGSQKQRGINVYDLAGNLLQSRADGRINNVDLRYGFQLGSESVAIVAGSNRSTDSISLYIIDVESRMLVDVADGVIPTGMLDPYGLCMYKSAQTNLFYVLINDTDGLVRQWQLEDHGEQLIGATLVREFNVGSQTEGCVADDETGDLYIGEENVGIWKYAAEPDGGGERTLVDGVDGNGNLTSDVEGLAIYYGQDGAGYLVASNQGADNYALYERAGDNSFIGIFHVVADEATGIDGISETDGLDVSSAYLGPDFPTGFFVAQDGRNITPKERQNFKLVPWQHISEAMGLE